MLFLNFCAIPLLLFSSGSRKTVFHRLVSCFSGLKNKSWKYGRKTNVQVLFSLCFSSPIPTNAAAIIVSLYCVIPSTARPLSFCRDVSGGTDMMSLSVEAFFLALQISFNLSSRENPRNLFDEKMENYYELLKSRTVCINNFFFRFFRTCICFLFLLASKVLRENRNYL